MVCRPGIYQTGKEGGTLTARQIIVKALKTLRLNRIAHHIYYNYVHGFAPVTRSTVEGLDKAFAKARELDLLSRGDYYEFGVFKGYSFWAAQDLAVKAGATSMRFFGFDSFEGLPETPPSPDPASKDFYPGQYKCSYDAVYRALDRKGVDWDKTTLIRGFFNQSLTPELREKHSMRPIAIALIDCDIYSSARDVLDFIEPLLVKQAILIFDDWNCYNRDNNKGERRAFRELLERHSDISAEQLYEYGSWGAVFLVKRG